MYSFQQAEINDDAYYRALETRRKVAKASGAALVFPSLRPLVMADLHKEGLHLGQQYEDISPDEQAEVDEIAEERY